MKKIQLKISASHFSKVVLIAASLSCSNLSYAADLSSSQMPLTSEQILTKIGDNLTQEIKSDASLEFQVIQLSQYETQEKEPAKLTKASTYNLGHLQDLLKHRFANKLTQLNELQELALAESPEFIAKSAALAYESFKFIFDVAVADTIETKTKLVAEETWTLRALVDYAQVTEAYKLIKAAKTNEHDKLIQAESLRLQTDLKDAKAKKIEEKASKDLEFNIEQKRLEKGKENAARLFEAESDPTRKKSYGQDVDSFAASLKKLGDDRVTDDGKYELGLNKLDAEYEAAINKLNSDKEVDLQSVKIGYGWLFESFGGSFGFKTVARWKNGRGFRSAYPEIAIFDELLSTKYKALYPRAKIDMLTTLFSLINGDDSNRQKKTLKTLLNIDDSVYRQIIQESIERENRKNSVLVQQNLTVNQQLSDVLSSSAPKAESSSVPSSSAEDSSKKKPDEPAVGVPTQDEAKIAEKISESIVTGVREKKAGNTAPKKKVDGTDNIESYDEPGSLMGYESDVSEGSDQGESLFSSNVSEPSEVEETGARHISHATAINGGGRLPSSPPIAIPGSQVSKYFYSANNNYSSTIRTFSLGSFSAGSAEGTSRRSLLSEPNSPGTKSSLSAESSTLIGTEPRTPRSSSQNSPVLRDYGSVLDQSSVASSSVLDDGSESRRDFLDQSSVASSPAAEHVPLGFEDDPGFFGLVISTPFGTWKI